ncbi:Epoxyqueuosine reductase [bioreactor metagenome]|uniref:Epoxyqueuosine reductase n=1 Tax=bioreactor metagenome TaxID=1076179 RepID=A0A644TJ89_9ZZZZ|nr:4Fe-4S double cluster binding domain-containing protein [Negativicutes bacterium]
MQTTDVETLNDIINILEEKGNMVYGFAYVGDIVPDKFRHLPYAITIGIPLSPPIVNNIIAGPNQAYYDEYLSVNDRLDLITEQLKTQIAERGYLAYAIPSSKRTDFVNISGEFPHKAAAVRGGLGWIGKSSLLITRKYGPRIRLSTVLTDFRLQVNDVLEKNYCGKCKKCVDECPASAIVGNHWSEGLPRESLINVQSCDVWKINNYPQFNGHVCGICVAACPHGSNKQYNI